MSTRVFPTPWRFDDEGDLVAADGTLPLIDDDGMTFLVRAVNTHDALVAALGQLLEDLGRHAHGEPAPGHLDHIREAHAAIAKAEGRGP